MGKRAFGWIGGALFLTWLLAAAAFAGGVEWIDGRPVDSTTVLLVTEPGADIGAVDSALASRGFGDSTVSLRSGIRVRADLASSLAKDSASIGHVVASVPEGMTVAEALPVARSVPGVRAADPNHLLSLAWTPNDPGFETYQQNFRQIYAEDAWEGSLGYGVTVAVIDTGYRMTGLTDGARHLADPADWWDFADADADPHDENGHGTHITNTIAEASNNDLGVAGLAPGATIMPLKIFPGGSNPSARESDMLDAVNWAVDHGAQVINLSLGGGGESDAGRETFAAAAERAILVCAAGNDGESVIDYPGAYDGCVTVGALGVHEVGEEGERSSFSNYGEQLDLLAPGEDVVQEAWSVDFGTAFFRAAGTSSATPHVSSVVALMIARAGRLERDALVETLASTAQDIGVDGWDLETGYGEVDAGAAVDAYAERFGTPPEAVLQYEARAALAVRFDATASGAAGEVAEWLWDFGDGLYSTERNPTHRYHQPGTYAVFLTVTDENGLTDTTAISLDVRLFSDGTATNPLGCGVGGSPGAAGVVLLVVAAGLALEVRRRARAWRR